ncbi:hypothetical protein APV28_2850 [Comamonas testosteroni]|nr:hypothetical protein APV28_2850 [Comamonas testosteroni]
MRLRLVPYFMYVSGALEGDAQQGQLHCMTDLRSLQAQMRDISA